MLKKILGLMMMLACSVIGLAETDISQIASDYPYKESAIMATVLGTPSEQHYKFKNPKGPKVKKFPVKKLIKLYINRNNLGFSNFFIHRNSVKPMRSFHCFFIMSYKNKLRLIDKLM